MESVVIPDIKDVVTVYFQGNFASRTQACKYAGPEGLDIRVTDNQVEHVFNTNAPRLLYNLFLYNELNDIQYEVSYNPFHWCCSLGQFVYQQYYNVYGTSCVPHNNLSRLNFAGSEDVAQCVNAVKACIKTHPEKRIVLFGTSRGAATILVSLTKLSKEELTHLKLVIAEAPFASIPSLLYNTLPACIVPYLFYMAEKLTLFKENQISPLHAVTDDAFPLEIPILFVTSEADRTIPIHETTQLIEVLKKREHKALNHLKLKRSSHSMMSIGDKDDQDAYYAELQRLYRKYL